MKCAVTEEQLALFSSRDLDPAEMLRLSSHIAQCPGCRENLVDFERTSNILSGALGEPDSHDLFALRAAVRSRIECSQRPSVRRWLPAVVVLFIAVLSLPVLQHRKTATVTKVTISSLPHLQYRVQLAPPIPVRVARRRPSMKAGLRHAELITTPQGKSELMIATADPNVLILLPMDQNPHEK